MERRAPEPSEPASEAIDASRFGITGLTGFLRPEQSLPVSELTAGARLGDVTIVRLIAEGGMGRVYEGLQGHPCRTVAVKLIRPGLLSAAAAKRFEHEAHILGRLTHPGIARIYSAGVHDHHGCALPYFVMEYVEDGRPITTDAADRGLSIRDRVRLFTAACAAVAHGHQRGVIHRDLKPGNILVDASGQPKVIDFGVARSTDGDVALTTLHTDANALVGTLHYMSPEQFDGAADDLDLRADVYSLGVVLYELLTGRLPYDLRRRAVYEAARVVREVDPAPLSTIDRHLRGDLDTIVRSCLEKDRTRRYSSAAELEADLGRYLRGEPIMARPPGLVDSLLRLARRHRVAAVTAASIAAALVAATAGISVYAVRAERERTLAVAERERADAASQEASEHLYVANVRSLYGCAENRNMRLGRQLLADTLAIADSPPPLELRVLAGAFDDALAVLTPGPTPIAGLAYGPDGTTLAVLAALRPGPPASPPTAKRPHSRADRKSQPAFFLGSTSVDRGRPRRLTRYDTAGLGAMAGRAVDDAPWLRAWLLCQGATVPEMDDAADGPEILAATADGRLQAVQHAEGRIGVQARDGGGEPIVLDAHRGRVQAVAFCGDGSRVAALSPAGHLTIWDATTGRLTGRIVPAGETIETFLFSPDGRRIAAVTNLKHRLQEVVIHDTTSGSLVATISRPHELGPPEFGRSGTLVAFSPDGRRLATTTLEHDLRVWNIADGSGAGTLRGHTAVVTALAFSPDGLQIASGAANGGVLLWDARSLELEHVRLGHETAVTTLAFAPDGETLASGEHGGGVRLWSRADAHPLARLPHAEGMTAVAFSIDGQMLAGAPGGHDAVEIWQARRVQRLHELPLAGRTVAELAFSPRSDLVAAACRRGGDDGDVLVWDARDGRLLATLGGHVRGADTVAFSPDGSLVVTTSGNDTAMVWESRTGRRLMAVAAGPHASHSKPGAVFGLDGSRMAFRRQALFDSHSGEVAVPLERQGAVTAVAASGDGRLLAAGLAIGAVYVTDFDTGRRLANLFGHTDGVHALAFSPDRRLLASGSLDGTIRLWDVTTGTELLVFRGHEGSVEMVRFTPDGRRLVSSSTDGTVRIWHASRGHELASLPGRTDHPRAVAISPAGDLLVTASDDGGTRIWGLSNADVTQARRELTAP
ncbi:MAG: WD40 repeat domain-containing serine/threonine protein kinase [Planctomycetaceae bacterium]